MIARNACEYIVSHPQLYGEISAIIKTYYRLARNLFDDAGWDIDDFSQETMMVLCEEPVLKDEKYYLRRGRDRMKNIIRDLYVQTYPLDTEGKRIPACLSLDGEECLD